MSAQPSPDQTTPHPPDKESHLEHLQILQSLLHQLLHPPRVLHALILPERVPRPALGILAKVVGRELVALAEELSVLQADAKKNSQLVTTNHRNHHSQLPSHYNKPPPPARAHTHAAHSPGGNGRMQEREKDESERRHTSDSTFCADSGLAAACTADMARFKFKQDDGQNQKARDAAVCRGKTVALGVLQ